LKHYVPPNIVAQVSLRRITPDQRDFHPNAASARQEDEAGMQVAPDQGEAGLADTGGSPVSDTSS